MYPKEKKDEVASQTEDVADAPDAEETINDATTDKDTETKQETPEATAPEFCETKKKALAKKEGAEDGEVMQEDVAMEVSENNEKAND